MYLLLYAMLKLQVKGILPYSKKVKKKIKRYTSDHFQYYFRFMLHSRGSNHNFYSLFVNLSTLLSCIELES